MQKTQQAVAADYRFPWQDLWSPPTWVFGDVQGACSKCGFPQTLTAQDVVRDCLTMPVYDEKPLISCEKKLMAAFTLYHGAIQREV